MPRISISGYAPDVESQWTQLYLGLGFTTLATMLLGLSLYRLFAVVFFPDFTFLAISLSLFGLSAGGLFSYAIANRPGNLSAELGRLTFINSVVVILLLWFLLSRHGDMSVTALAAVSLASAVPFFFAGTVMSLAVSEAIVRIGRAYLWNLMGAAAACVLLGPFMTFFGGPNTVIASSVIYGIAASIWFNRAGQVQLRASAALVSILLVTLMIMNGTNHMFDVRWATGERLPEERLVKWDAVSRVGVSKVGDHWEIRRDTDTPMRIASDTKESALPHLLRPAAKTLILGAGAGYEVAQALASGSKDITAIEPNLLVAQLMQDELRKESFSVYDRPEVRIKIDDPRHEIRNSQEKYQIIQLASAGEVVPSANYLYTAEAFEEYLAHLTEDGIVAFSLPGFDWKRVAAQFAGGRLIVLTSFNNQVTVMISRSPFMQADVEHAAHIGSESGLEAVSLPGDGPGAFFSSSDTTPPTDDRPFIFDDKDGSPPLLYGLAAICVAVVALVAFLPRLALVPIQQDLHSQLVYFLFSGTGYVLVLIALVQKLTLTLGQPSRSLIVIVVSMLVASGAGSYFSRVIIGALDRRLALVLASAAGAIAILATAPLTPIATSTVARILLTAAAIAPTAFLMGIAFPSGLRRLEESHVLALRWAWSLNAAAGVMGAVTATLFATSLGIRATLLIGAALYLGAMLVILITRRDGNVAQQS